MTALPYFIAVSDGSTIRTIHPPALGEHRAAVEAALADLLNAGKSGNALGHGHDTHTSEGTCMTQAVEGVTHAVHPPSVSAQVAPKIRPATAAMLTQGEIARVQGFTGDCCTGCGGFTMRRNGTCLLCTACGSTTGCS